MPGGLKLGFAMHIVYNIVVTVDVLDAIHALLATILPDHRDLCEAVVVCSDLKEIRREYFMVSFGPKGYVLMLISFIALTVSLSLIISECT